MTTYPQQPTYTIREASVLSGLPESTLRYYETIGLIHSIRRDTSSKHRIYGEEDVNYAIAVACLNAAGMSLEDMRTYLRNRSKGTESAQEQIELLQAQQKRLADEARYLGVRQRYVETKIAYWAAVRDGDQAAIDATGARSRQVVQELRAMRGIQSASRAEKMEMTVNGAHGSDKHKEER